MPGADGLTGGLGATPNAPSTTLSKVSLGTWGSTGTAGAGGDDDVLEAASGEARRKRSVAGETSRSGVVGPDLGGEASASEEDELTGSPWSRRHWLQARITRPPLSRRRLGRRRIWTPFR